MSEFDALGWVCEVFEESPGRIRATTRREEIPGWDSLGTLTLIAAFDERFEIQLSEGDSDRKHCVDDILGILRRHGALAA